MNEDDSVRRRIDSLLDIRISHPLIVGKLPQGFKIVNDQVQSPEGTSIISPTATVEEILNLIKVELKPQILSGGIDSVGINGGVVNISTNGYSQVVQDRFTQTVNIVGGNVSTNPQDIELLDLELSELMLKYHPFEVLISEGDLCINDLYLGKIFKGISLKGGNILNSHYKNLSCGRDITPGGELERLAQSIELIRRAGPTDVAALSLKTCFLLISEGVTRLEGAFLTYVPFYYIQTSLSLGVCPKIGLTVLQELGLSSVVSDQSLKHDISGTIIFDGFGQFYSFKLKSPRR